MMPKKEQGPKEGGNGLSWKAGERAAMEVVYLLNQMRLNYRYMHHFTQWQQASVTTNKALEFSLVAFC